VSINLEESPERPAAGWSQGPGTSAVRPHSSRPKSALRFLDGDDKSERERLEREWSHASQSQQRALSLLYADKCEGVIDGVTKCLGCMEAAMSSAQRSHMASKDLARDHIKRLMDELDRERHTTKKLSLTIDQKNQKIQELTQALKADQEARGVGKPTSRVGEHLRALRMPVRQ